MAWKPMSIVLESLGLYLDHFDSFGVACPVRTSQIEGSGLERCRPVRDLPWGTDRLKLIPLPTTHQPMEFVRHLPAVRTILQSEITRRYSSDLVKEHVRGLFTKLGDCGALAKNVHDLDNNRDRDKLRTLIRHAARSGQNFGRAAALLKRVDLVKHSAVKNYEAIE